jgi:ABC-type phosphate/phosphonate transport system substrate-binding protein
MNSSHFVRPWPLLLAGGLIALVSGTAPAQKPPSVLKVGTTGSLAAGTSGADEKGALDTLHNFIKSETGFENDIVDHKGWQELAEKLEKGTDNVGVFQGFELAWALEKYPKLKPLAVAVNGQPYRQIFVVTRKDSKAKRIDELKEKKVAVMKAGQGYPLLVLQTLAKAEPKSFFSLQFADNAEDALDDLVDGKVDAAAVDRVAIDAFKRRKPGRFAQLKELIRSKNLPSTTIVYYDGKLDEATVNKFRDGLVNANKKEKGRTLLTYFKLTGFAAPPEDFKKLLDESRKNYPLPAQESTE